MNYRDKDWLREKYWDEKMNTTHIAVLEGVSSRTIGRWMKKFGIPKRTVSEAHQAINLLPETRQKMSESHRGQRASHWKGGRCRDKNGYILIWKPDHPHAIRHASYVLEHRLVIENALGRYLKSNEFVHHINGIRDDNRLENLELIDKHRRRMCPRCGWPLENMFNVVLEGAL